MIRREYPDAPIAAVGAVVLDAERRVLLVRRTNAPQKGAWSLPGGAVELGETLEGAISRELLEETGLVVEVMSVLEVLGRIVVDPAGRVQYHYVLVDFLCRLGGGELCCASDASEAAWISEAEIMHGAAQYDLADLTLQIIRKAMSADNAGKTQS